MIPTATSLCFTGLALLSATLHAAPVITYDPSDDPVADLGYTLEADYDFETNLQGFTANALTSVAQGTSTNFSPSEGALIGGPHTGGDPQFISPTNINVSNAAGIIVEMKIYMSQAGTGNVFWQDDAGSFAAARKFDYVVPAAATPLVVRATFTPADLDTQLKRLRIDPIGGTGQTGDIAYVRIYAGDPTAQWDPDGAAGAQGGTGTWDNGTTANWYVNGGNVTWNTVAGGIAIFDGTPGTVTAAAGVLGVNQMIFEVDGYLVDGSAVDLQQDAILWPSVGNGVEISQNFSEAAVNLDITGGGTLTLSGTSTFNSVNIDDAFAGNGGIGGVDGSTLVIPSGATLTTDGNDGFGSNQFGFRLRDGTSLIVDGTLNINAGNRFGTFSAETNATATVNSGGSLTATGETVVGWNSNMTITLNGGATTLANVRHQDGGAGTLNVNAGATLTSDRIYNQGGTGSLTVNWDGGSLVGTSADLFLPSFTHNDLAIHNLLAGGLSVDTNGNDVSLPNAFTGATAGDFTKSGVGEMRFGGSDSSGDVTVTGGSLHLDFGAEELSSSGGGAMGNAINGAADLVLDGGDLIVTGRDNADAASGTFAYDNNGPNTNWKLLRNGDTSNLVVGMEITGTNATAGTFITHILDGSTLRMNNDATGGNAGNATFNFAAVSGNTSSQTFATATLNEAATVTVDTNGGSGTTVTFSSLAGTGDLTKAGDGSLIVSAVSSFTGSVNVNGGTFQIDTDDSIDDAASVDVATGATLDLNFAGTDTVDQFLIAGVLQAAGEWGATGSGAANESPRITGTGRLNATTGSNAYASWVSDNSLVGPDALITTDVEPDGLVNMLEFGFGTDPNASDNVPLVADGSVNGTPIVQHSGGGGGITFEALFVRRDDHGAVGSASYTAQFSSDLVTFYDSTATPAFVADSSVDPDYEVVSIPYPATLPNGKKARFFRMKVDPVE